MDPLFTPYRDHAIHITTPGQGGGPFLALYSVWRFEPAINNYTGILQGTDKNQYPTREAAAAAALAAARRALDELLR